MPLPVIPADLIDATCAAAGLEASTVSHIEWDAKTNLVTFNVYLTRDGKKCVDDDGEPARDVVLASIGRWS
jgi:hypothetical protein